MTKRKSYDTADVDRWLRAYAEDIELIQDNLRLGSPDPARELAACAARQEMIALAHIARAEYRQALGQMSAAGQSWAAVLERAARAERVRETLMLRSPTGLFLAVGSGDEDLLARMTGVLYSAYERVNALNTQTASYMMSLGALCLRDRNSAADYLNRIVHDDTTEPYTRLLESIISEDEAAFGEVIRDSARYWKERVRSERLQRHPDAVCDLYGFTKIRLAERVWGRRPDVDLEAGQIPPGLFDAHPESVDQVM